MNAKPQIRGASKYTGVCFSKHHNKWVVRIVINGSQKHLGYFINEKEGARKYNDEAIKLFGEFALLNKLNDE